MKKNMFKRSFLALAGVAGMAFLAQSGQASTLTYTSGDLLVGFTDSSDSNDYVIDLGSASTFINATGTLSLGNIGADLTAVFGSGWATDGSVNWSLAGTTYNTGGAGLGTYVNFLSQAESTPGTAKTPWAGLATGGRNNLASKIAAASGVSAGSGYGGQIGNATNPAGLIQSATALNSWTTDMANGFTSGHTITGNFANGAAGTVLDVDQMSTSTNGTGTDLGTLTIDSSGNLTFTSANAAPEPSTYALLGLSGLLVLAFRSRMKRATV